MADAAQMAVLQNLHVEDVIFEFCNTLHTSQANKGL